MQLPESACSVINILYQSYEYSVDCACDPWEFAIELDELRAAGATNNVLRWLLQKGFLIQAAETTNTKAQAQKRTFTSSPNLSIAHNSCFILTDIGILLATGRAARHAPPIPQRPGLQPIWEQDVRRLLLGTTVVKHYRVPAKNQEIILAAFEEEGWPHRIDDPLPGHSELDPKRRLHDTINSLNRNQRVSTLRFFGDGRGEAVCWEILSHGETPDPESSTRRNSSSATESALHVEMNKSKLSRSKRIDI